MIPRSLRPAILQGHVLEVLPTLPDESVHCVVTSPPYWGLRTYGTPPQVWGGRPGCIHEWETATIPSGNGQVTHPMVAKTLNEASATRSPRLSTSCRQCGAWKGELGLEPTPDLYVDHLADVFDAVHRVLRSDGTLWLNLGDTSLHHPAGLTGAKRWKSSTLVVRDHTGAEQAGSIDKRTPGLKEKDLVGIPWKVAFELQRRGWYLREDCIWAKKNPMPEPVRDRPTRSHEYVFLFSKSRRVLLRRRGGEGTAPGELATTAPPSPPESEGQPAVPFQAPEGRLPPIPDAREHRPNGPQPAFGLADRHAAVPWGSFRNLPRSTARGVHSGWDVSERSVRGLRHALGSQGPCRGRGHRPRLAPEQVARPRAGAGDCRTGHPRRNLPQDRHGVPQGVRLSDS